MVENKRILLVGGGGHAAVVADAIRASGGIVVGCVDDDESIATDVERLGMRWLGPVRELAMILPSQKKPLALHAAVGRNNLRRQWMAQHGSRNSEARWVTIAHPSAVISPNARIEAGVFVGPRAVINARAEIGVGAIINSAAVIEHDCRIGSFAHIAPHATIAGGARVGTETLIGCAATVLPAVELGERSILAAGAVATENIPDGVTAIGVPAKVGASYAV